VLAANIQTLMERVETGDNEDDLLDR
jgi:hypothetical protein